MPTMPTSIDLRLATKGRNQGLDSLLEQAKISAGLAKLHAATLTVAAWTPARTTELEAEIASLQGDVVHQIDAANLVHHATQKEHAAIDAAKEFTRKIRAAVPMVLRDTKAEGIPADAFHVGGTLGRSAARIAGYLLAIKAPLTKLDADFAPYFNGKSPLAILLTVSGELDVTDVVQEAGIKSLPEESLRVFETKGRLLEHIEDLNRMAKIAFDGDARARALFNKDIILRARKHATTKPATDATGTTAGPDKTATTTPTETAPKGTKNATTTPSETATKGTKIATNEPAQA